MKKLVFGALNIDRTYLVKRFILPGETLSADKMELFCGGKGFNQAVALARAGNEVYFAGAVGEDGGMLLEALAREHIRAEHVRRLPGATGHAVIQVDAKGQNCILILSGANGEITSADVDQVLAGFARGDLIVLQNEISCMEDILQKAHALGMTVALNPSPFDERAAAWDLSMVDYLLVNEVEGAQITGSAIPGEILRWLHEHYPSLAVVLTLGQRGAAYIGPEGRIEACGVYHLPVEDTTAAGDAFTGYFLSEMLRHGDARRALEVASLAGGIAVSRKGASPSIPYWSEVEGLEPQKLLSKEINMEELMK